MTEPDTPPTDAGSTDAGNTDSAAAGPGVETETGDRQHWAEPDRTYVMAALTKLGGDQAELAARLTVTEDRVEDLAVALDGIEDAATTAAAALGRTDTESDPGAGAGGGGGAATDQGGVDAAVLDMAELVAWVGDHITLLLERKLPRTGTPPFWCRKWWLHAEAIARFEAVRRSWAEAVTADGNAMVVYFEHLDHQLAVLMGDGGPFASCTGGEHRAGGVTALGQDAPDAAYFTSVELLDTG